jgi:hypothetical protein
MPWSRALPSPIVLNDGRRLVTLGNAAQAILAVPPLGRNRNNWELASDLLMKAAGEGAPTDDDLAALNEQLALALKAEGLI